MSVEWPLIEEVKDAEYILDTIDVGATVMTTAFLYRI